MRVFVAGGSGTIGKPLVESLVQSGHDVIALTRSSERAAELVKLGAEPAIANALDRNQMRAAVTAARPECIIHQLTALPVAGPRRAGELVPTNRLRTEGTRYLIEAAIASGARRFVVGSFAPLAPRHADQRGEETARAVDAAAAAVRSMEDQVLEATKRGHLDGIVLRYGLFYGPRVPGTEEMVALVRRRLLPAVRHDASLLPYIHIADAVSATVAAVRRGRVDMIYEVVDDQAMSLSEMLQLLAQSAGAPPPRRVPAWLLRLLAPYLAKVTSRHLQLSNEDTKRDLGWAPRYPTVREGLADMLKDVRAANGVAA